MCATPSNNHSRKKPVHLVQLWITPAVQHLEPSWEQKSFSVAGRSGKLLPIALPSGSKSNGAVQIHQGVSIYTLLLAPDPSVAPPLAEGRRAYIFVIGGNLKLSGETLGSGDQARISSERELQLSATSGPGATAADFLLLDLP